MASTVEFLWGAAVGGTVGYAGGGIQGATTGVAATLTFPVLGDLLSGLLDPDVQAGVAGLLSYARTGQGNQFNADQIAAAMAEGNPPFPDGEPTGGLYGELFWVRFVDQVSSAQGIQIRATEFYTNNIEVFGSPPFVGPMIESEYGSYLDWYVSNFVPASLTEDLPYLPTATPDNL